MALPQGSHVLHKLNREKHGKIFLSKTKSPIALIFDMQHHLVDLYQVCSNYAPVAKNGPSPGVTYLTQAYIGKNMEKSSCLKM